GPRPPWTCDGRQEPGARANHGQGCHPLLHRGAEEGERAHYRRTRICAAQECCRCVGGVSTAHPCQRRKDGAPGYWIDLVSTSTSSGVFVNGNIVATCSLCSIFSFVLARPNFRINDRSTSE